MNIKDLFFHVHYCNTRLSGGVLNYSKKINKTLKYHELVFITGGKGHIIFPHKRYEVKDGVLLYLRPNVQYSVNIHVEDPFCFFVVHFSYVNVGFNSDKWIITEGTNTLPLDSVQVLKDYYQLNNIFEKLVENWTLKLPGYEFFTKTLLQQLIIEIYKSKKRDSPNYSTSLKVEKIIEYMRSNINNKLILKDLSELVHLSSSYLSRVFKSTTGYSIIGFFNKIKVDKAKELIIEDDKKIKEVAQILGFTDEFYFSRIFKKIEGISPTEFYRRNVHGY
ncbi:AraC family transcriptional regulator [Clostridium akagii]|uniref:AraC family transcriptional regulator n=1 Tax=Clostridium akagii TaxID=91623 RepID=UPI00047B54FB|nr:AraC family transcriptional regulator [Clostridium akagii]